MCYSFDIDFWYPHNPDRLLAVCHGPVAMDCSASEGIIIQDEKPDPRATYDFKTSLHGKLWDKVFGDKPEL